MRGTGRCQGLWVWLLSPFALACGTAKPVERPPVMEARPEVPAASKSLLYAADEALRDAMSGPLEYVGTGKWPGVERMYACAFRNQRVLLVSAYCSPTEVNAFRVDVYSPTRGRVRIYAESRGAFSTRTRPDYFTFTAESEPLPGPELGLAPPSLGMSFADLRAYDEQRYAAYLPACYGGTELQRPREGCLGSLAPHVTEWAHRNQDFLQGGNQDWYQLVHEMRALATQHGRDPEE